MNRLLQFTAAMFIFGNIVFAQTANSTGRNKLTNARLSQREAAKVRQLFADYWEYELADDPLLATSVGDFRFNDKLKDISEAAYLRRYTAARAFLKRANEVTQQQRLTMQEQISLKMLRRELPLKLEGKPIHFYLETNYLMPINHMVGFHLDLLGLPDQHPFASIRDYQTYIERLHSFPAQVDDAIVNMRKGIKLGVVLPKLVVEKILPQLEAGIVSDAGKSPFYQPVEHFTKEISATDKAKLTAAIESEILTTVAPAYRKLSEFMRTEYLPNARETFGLSALPRGKEMYRYEIKVYTTTDLSPEEIHQFGLREVAKLNLERQNLLKEIGFSGTIREFNEQLEANKQLRWFDAASIERDLRKNLKFIEARLPQFFSNIPQANYELKPFEAFRAASAPGGQYVSSSDGGSRSATFYYNTYDAETKGIRKYDLPNLAFHEVVPGHHLQFIYALANNNLPAFRRFGWNPAYGEGWAKYAERLADELGAYPDSYARYQWLSNTILSYAKLVTETGIHDKGWTRERILAFYKEQLQETVTERQLNNRLARTSALFAEGLTFGIGAGKIFELRAKAQRKLGNRFDIRAFHNVVLNNGSVPLNILDELIDAWIARAKTQFQTPRLSRQGKKNKGCNIYKIE